MGFKQGWHPGDMPCSFGVVIVNADGKETARYSEEQWAQKLLHDRLERIEAKLDQLLKAQAGVTREGGDALAAPGAEGE